MTAMPHPTSSTPNGGYVSSELLWLKLEHLTTTVDQLGTNLMSEVRALRVEGVRRDVYDEQRRADQAELDRLRAELSQRSEKPEVAQLRAELTVVREELKESKQRKWAVWLALAGVVLTLGKDLLSAMIQTQ